MREMTVRELASMGGHARAAKLTQKRLSEIGTKAVKTRWRKTKQEGKNKKKGKTKQ
jgi:methylmalonyl-CoA mutase cobalamin-binding subunit